MSLPLEIMGAMRTERYWEYDEGLIFLVTEKRTRFRTHEVLHSRSCEVVCPHCEERHNVWPHEASRWLEEHSESCPSRPREGNPDEVDQWAVRRILAGRFGYRRKRELTDVGRSHFEARLNGRLERTNSDIARENAALRAKEVDAHEAAPTRISGEEKWGRLNSLIRRREALEDALERVGAQAYGVCADCQGDIDDDRLDALPEALLCLACATLLKR